jgi:tetratricopeptide (TPR) repeat protein
LETLSAFRAYSHGPLVELTALEVHDLYGGGIINAVMARGSAKVPSPPQDRGRAVPTNSGPMSREDARGCGPLFYVPSYQNLRADEVWYADGRYDGRLVELTALDVYDLYGPGMIEEVQEYGSANVPPPPEGRGRAIMRPPSPPPEPPPPPPRYVGWTESQIALREAWDARDYERAIPLLEEFIRADPRDWNARDRLATALIAVARVPDAVPILIKIADWYAEEGFYAVARGRFLQVQRLSPDHPGIAARLAALEAKGGSKGE